MLVAGALATSLLPAVPAPATAVEPPLVGAWRTTGPLHTPRQGAVATVLGGTPCAATSRPAYCGRVLVTGGTSDGGELASAELYDPTTGAWQLTGSMAATHGGAHVAVALAGGHVLVVGGVAHPRSAELYDPATGTWRTTAPPPFDVYADAAVPLTGGKALVVTSEQRDPGITTAAVFDPAGDDGKGSWAPTAPTSQPHPTPTLTVLGSGQVLVVGGASAERYDPQTQVWTPAGALPAPISSRPVECDRVHCHSATLLSDGRVLVVGLQRADTSGGLPMITNDDVALYRPADNSWELLPGQDGKRPPSRQPAVRLQDGRVLVAGRAAAGVQTVDPMVFGPAESSASPDPSDWTWAPAGSMVVSRKNPAIALLEDGRVLAAGGNPDVNSSAGETADAELFGWSTTVPPSITSLEPPSAPSGASPPTVTITGAGFDAANVVVQFGDRLAGVVESSATELVVAAPPQAAGRVPVTVSTGSSGNAVASAVTANTYFTYYDPVLATSPGPPLQTARTGHTATTVADGRILVIGGASATGEPLSSVELFDPAGGGGTGTWTQVATLIRARTRHAAVLLGDGSVLVTGGLEVPDQVPDTPPVPDPDPAIPEPALRSTERLIPGAPWKVVRAGDLVTGRADHTATVLTSGRVLVTGGVERAPQDQPDAALGSTELYDPATSAWSTGHPMGQPRRSHTATALTGAACASGAPPEWCATVLVAGGDAGSGTTAEVYSPAGGSWAPTGPMGESRAGHTATATAITDPTCAGAPGPGECAAVVVVGGSETVAAEAYRPATGDWLPVGRLVRARRGHTATALDHGDVVVAGGTGDAGPVEVLSSSRRDWSPLGPLLVARSHHTASLVGGGRLVLAGGCTCDVASSVEVLRVPTSPPTPSITSVDPPAGPSATSTRVVVRGSGLGATTAASFGGVRVPVMSASGQAVVLNAPAQAQGTVAVVLHASGGDTASAAGVFTYGPGAWRRSGPVEGAGQCGDGCGRYLHAAAPLPAGANLPQGGVLVTGGTTNFFDFARLPTPDRVPRPLATARLYDAGADAWREATAMTTARFAHTATALPDGRVLVAGGQDDRGQAIASAEIYDPTRNEWAPAGTLGSARFSHTATLLDDGRVLVAGGAVDEERRYLALASAEMYDPGTGRWSPATAMSAARQLHTATVLPDGRVLVAGGLTGPSVAQTPGLPRVGAAVLDAAEVFDPRTGLWSTTGPMSVGRYTHTATLIDGPRCRRPRVVARCGTVVVAGGGSGGEAGSSSTEVYDPARGVWDPAPSLGTARAGHSATLLADGAVLVAGGGALFPGDLQPGPLGGAEVFDPQGGWLPTDWLGAPRAGHTATLLADGEVVVAGGYRDVEYVDGVFHVTLSQPGEVYTPAPYVTEVAPAAGPVGVRTEVVISGTGFAGTRAVGFGDGADADAEFEVASTRSLRARTPPRAVAGSVAVAVVNAGGTSATLSSAAMPSFAYQEAEGPVDDSIGSGGPLPCPPLPDDAGPGQVRYPGRRYSLVGLPAGTVVAADSPLYGWADQGAGGRYSVHPAPVAVAAGTGYWAYFRCPATLDIASASAPAAMTLPLGSYHASMVGNPSPRSVATVAGHDFAAQWDPHLNGAGGYRLSGYRDAQPLPVGAGAWVFSYRDTTVSLTAP